MTALDDIIDTFTSVEPQTRLELLLDFADRLPPLPPRFQALRDAGVNQVHECQTPVFLFVEPTDGHLKLFIDVAPESPTVRGFASILVKAYDGAPRDDVANAPADLFYKLGLADQIRMTRAVGLSALVSRLKRQAAETGAATS